MSNYKALGDIAFKSRNYEEAFSYFAKAVEDDFNDLDSWVFKGLSAGFLSTSEKLRVVECISLIRHATTTRGKREQPSELDQFAANCLIDIYEHNIRTLNSALVSRVEDSRKNTKVSEGTFANLVAQNLNVIQLVKRQAEDRVGLLELMNLMIELNPSSDNYIVFSNAVNGLLNHSNSNHNYLQDAKPGGLLLQRVQSIQNDLSSRIASLSFGERSRIEANMHPKAAPPKKEGCFIATAALGSYDHPKVIHLRVFRDLVLRSSSFGRTFIRVYYRFSPSLAKVVSNSPLLKRFTRILVVNPCFYAALALTRLLRK